MEGNGWRMGRHVFLFTSEDVVHHGGEGVVHPGGLVPMLPKIQQARRKRWPVFSCLTPLSTLYRCPDQDGASHIQKGCLPTQASLSGNTPTNIPRGVWFQGILIPVKLSVKTGHHAGLNYPNSYPRAFLHAAPWTWGCVDPGLTVDGHTFSTHSLQPCAEHLILEWQKLMEDSGCRTKQKLVPAPVLPLSTKLWASPWTVSHLGVLSAAHLEVAIQTPVESFAIGANQTLFTV